MFQHIFLVLILLQYTSTSTLAQIELKSACDEGDTKWNDKNIGNQLRFWLDTIELDPRHG